MNLSPKKMYGFLLLPLFFPFIGFFPGVDTQPVFLIVAFLMFFLLFKHIKFDLIFFIVFIVSVISIVIRFSLEVSYLDFKYVFTYLGALLTFFLIYTCIDNGYLKPTLKFVILVSIFYIAVGVIQLFVPDFMANVVNRSVEHALSYAGSGRGVRSLTGEPTALGKIFTTLNVILIFLIYISEIANKHRAALITCLICFLVSALLSRSAYALVIHISLIFTLVFLINKKLFFALLTVMFFIITSLLSYLYMYSDIRVINILNQLMTEPEALLQQGAMRRVLNIPISLNNLQYFGFLGAGNSPDTFSGLLSTPIGNLNYMAFNRNLGGFVEFILRFGMFSIPIILIYFHMCFRILLTTFYVDDKKFRIGIFLFCAVLLLTFQDSSPVQPLSWFLLAYLYLYHRKSIYRE
jgi:hypothetical protein